MHRRLQQLKLVSAVAAFLAVAPALGGCAGLPIGARTDPKPTVADSSPVAADTKTIVVEKAPVAISTLQLSVTYLERLAIAPGATLTVTVTDSKGTKVGSSTVTTGAELPYQISVPLTVSAQEAVTVKVTLKAPAGHVLAGSKTFPKVPAGKTEFVIASS